MTCSFPLSTHNSAFVFSLTGSWSKLCIGCMSGTLACYVRDFVCDICFSTRCREGEAISLLNNMTCSIWLFQVSDSPCSLSRFPMPRKSVLLLVPAWAKAIADGGNCSAPSESAESSLLTLSKFTSRYEVGTAYSRMLGPLACHFAADRGVQKHHDGSVSVWHDLSGNEKHAKAVGTVRAPKKGRGMPVNYDPRTRRYSQGTFRVDHPCLEGGERQAHMFLVISPALGRRGPHWMFAAPGKDMILFQIGDSNQGPQLTLSFGRRFRKHKHRAWLRRFARPVCYYTYCMDFKGFNMAQSKRSCVCAPLRTTLLEFYIDFVAQRMSLKRRHEHHTPKSQSQTCQTQSTALLTEEALAEHNANTSSTAGDYKRAGSSSASDSSESSGKDLRDEGKIDSNVRQLVIGRALGDAEVGDVALLGAAAAKSTSQAEEVAKVGFSGLLNEILVYRSRVPGRYKDRVVANLRRKWISKKTFRSGSSLLQLSGQGAAQDGDDEDDEGLLPVLWFEADSAEQSVDGVKFFQDSSGNENTLTPRLEGQDSLPDLTDAPNTDTPIRTLNFFNTPLGAERPVYGGIDGLEAWFVACFKATPQTSDQDRFVFDMGEYAKQGYGCFMRTSRCTCYAANNMVTVNADMTKGCFMARFRAEFGDGQSFGTLSLILNNDDSLSAVIEAKDPNWPLLSLNSTTVDDAEGRKPFTIGGQSKDYNGGVRWFPGYISEVQIFDRLLDDTDADTLQTALQGKWNTTS